MNNIFVKDAIETKKIFNNQLKEINKITETLKNKKNKEKEYSKYDLLNSEIYEMKSDLQYITDELVILKNDYSENENKIYNLRNILTEINEDIEIFNKNKENIKNNFIIKNNIKELKNKIEKNKEYIFETNNKIKKLETDTIISKNKIDDLKKDIKKYKELYNNSKLYNYYSQAISRDGIPYLLINKIVPIIEQETNNILELLTDFKTKFIMDGKNIDINIVYNKQNNWNVTIASGFERFIISLAIRIAMIKISNLPASNFIAIDEG
jgi:DNA repair exonuclease SbcCD ATPase subunit